MNLRIGFLLLSEKNKTADDCESHPPHTANQIT